MTPLAFGETAPCRTCRGTGKSRNPEWGDKDAARERQRNRRRGVDVEKPTEIIACIECNGAGYLPLPVADSQRVDRDTLRASR